MAEVILRLRVDPATGKRELVVDYTSDSDALPIEHEDEHRRLAAGVVDGGLNSGKVKVTRDGDSGGGGGGTGAAEPVAQPVAPVATKR